MSSVVISGDTSGAITLSAPAVSGTNTITLPASTGTAALLQTPSFATTIGVGGATPSTSGAGITFPATASASTDANTLDDYEEGTWTPTFSSWGGTFTTVATYAKIGKVVYFNVTVTQVSGTVTSTANSSSFTLPFTISAEGVFSGSTASITSNGQGVAYQGTTAYSPTMSIGSGKGYMTGFYFTSA